MDLADVQGDRLRDLREDDLLLALDQRIEQTGQITELRVDDRTRDAGPLGDGIDRERLSALLGEDLEGDVEELLASLGRRHARTTATA